MRYDWAILSEKIKKLYVDEQLSSTVVSQKLNIPLSTVLKHIKEKGWSRPSSVTESRQKYLKESLYTDDLKQTIIDLYIDQNLSFTEVCKKLNFSNSKLTCLIKYFDIKKPKELKNKIRQNTNLEKYGVANVMFDSKIRQAYDKNKTILDLESIEKRRLKRLNSSRYPDEVKQILSSAENLKNFILSLEDKSVMNITSKLDVDPSVFRRTYLHPWKLEQYIESDPSRSFPEKELEQYIKSFYNGEVIHGVKVLGDCDIDIYLPSKKLGFEYHGSYWHSTKFNRISPRVKTQKALKLGIRLIHIYDFEWFNHKENVKRFVYDLIKTSKKHLIRSQEVIKISKKDYNDFCSKNHLYGNGGKATIFLGIYSNNELVAVAGFSKSRSPKYNWEWRRFCVKFRYFANFNIRKIFLTYFAKSHKGLLVDYQQMDRFPTISSERMGFKKLRWNEGFVCVDTIHKQFKYTRHRFIPEDGLTSLETMKKYGYDVEVPNAGTITWIKEI